ECRLGCDPALGRGAPPPTDVRVTTSTRGSPPLLRGTASVPRSGLVAPASDRRDCMKSVQLVLTTAFVALIAAAANAGVVATGVTSITVGDNPFFPPSGGTGDVASFDPNAQTAVLEKDFTQIGDIPIIIDRGPSQGVDTFHIDERVKNDTGVDWTDFHFVFQALAPH